MLSDKIAKSSQTSKMCVAASFIGIIAFALYSWIVSPHTTYLHAACQQEAMLGNSGKKVEKIRTLLEIKTAQLAELQLQVDKVQKRLFTSQRGKEFFLDLDPISMTSNCDVTWKYTNAKQPSQKETQIESEFTITMKTANISLTGTYSNIIKFLAVLTNRPEYISISSISIENSEFGQKLLVCKMTMTIFMIDDKEIINDEEK